MVRRSTMRRVRQGKGRGREKGFLVTWDVNSANRVAVNRVRRFVFGDVTHANGVEYRYPGFVEKEEVRYLGQSVVFVRQTVLAEIVGFLSAEAVDHEVTPVTLG